jgi:YD repeat-containing protein
VSRDRVDLNANGVFTNGPPDAAAFGEMDDTRVYNKRNELRERSVLDSTNPTTPRIVALDYDRNGNLTSDGEKHTYTFNPFGQLVRINDHRHGDLIARFTYNGLGQRISEQTDVNNAANTGEPDGLVTTSDPVFYLAVDPQGRRVATYRHEDKYPKETFVWTLAGISGPGGVANGTLILRDRNENGADPLAWATGEGIDARPERHYSVSDHTGSVVALLALHTVNDGPTAKLAEQYRSSVTGVPYGIPLGDVDASGQVEDAGGFSPDKNIVADMAASNVYQVRGDVNLDGLVDSQDIAIVDAALGTSTGRGYFGIITLRNRVGLSQLERTLRVGPGWNTGGGVYREDVGKLTDARSHEFTTKVYATGRLDATTGQSVKVIGCNPQVWQALRDPDVADRLLDARISCRRALPDHGKRPIIVIRCVDCSDSSATGWGDGLAPEITLCTGDLVGVPKLDFDTIKNRLIHEIVHARQSCEQGHLFYLNGQQAICAELEAYCAQSDIRCDGSEQSVNSSCMIACNSAEIKFRGYLWRRLWQPWTYDPHDLCVSTCLEIHQDCVRGMYLPKRTK